MMRCPSVSHNVCRTVMVSGHFDIFHQGHLTYLEQATHFGDKMICVVSSDPQVMKKKGKVNIPGYYRCHIVDLILRGLGIDHDTVINQWDTETTLVAEALRYFRPDVFCRGGDKTIDDMPPDELRVCNESGIKIVHAKPSHDVHGSTMELSWTL